MLLGLLQYPCELVAHALHTNLTHQFRQTEMYAMSTEAHFAGSDTRLNVACHSSEHQAVFLQTDQALPVKRDITLEEEFMTVV